MNKTEMVMVSVPRELLKVASCPCCDGSGGFYDGDGEACQCQWCFERNAILAQPVADEQAEQQPAVWATHPKGAAVDADCGLVGAEEAKNYAPGCVTPLYAAPIAQTVAQHVMEENEKLRGLLREAVHCCPDEQLRNEMKAALSQLTVPSQPKQSGLVEALEKYADINNWDYDGCSVSPDVAEEALATYRAALSVQGDDT